MPIIAAAQRQLAPVSQDVLAMREEKMKIIAAINKTICILFLIMFTLGALISLGTLFEIESLHVNIFGITGETFIGSITCVVISSSAAFLTWNSLRKLARTNGNQGIK